ncbi:MAG: metalloprotease TldD [Rickettsiales bacterium]|nr:metalloprotease TldD [Rickettsiales bacterium]
MLNTAKNIFFNNYGLNEATLKQITSDSLSPLDDGELFMEYSVSESILYDEGNLKNASSDTTQGYGLRGVLGESTAYAHSSILDINSIKNSTQVINALKTSAKSFKQDVSPAKAYKNLYNPHNPLEEISFSEKLEKLKFIDEYLRKKDENVKQVSASIASEWQVVYILRADGSEYSDVRPLVRVNISIVYEKDGKKERGSYGMGGRSLYSDFINQEKLIFGCDKALKEAKTSIEALPSPAGEMDIVLGSGWPGILLHEAVGHGLEGDFNRKKTSAFSGLMGQRVAAKGVTVIDDGTIDNRRGSLTIDDEGTPTNKTILIEDGILVGYIQDRLNARLMGVKPTGNGRRESYEHSILPRMTNTYMLNGNSSQEELISRVKNGIYAVSFGGGQVDITSGKFVFSANEAYKIEDGKIKYPVKGATIIGNGPECLKNVKGIANDMKLDDGVGTCGKDGQGVPVGVGQPSLLISGLTIGGTEV